MPSSQGSASFDIEGDSEEVTWLVHVSKKKDYSKDALLKAIEEAEAEEQRPTLVLFHVVTSINTPIGTMQVTQASKAAVREVDRDVKLNLLKPYRELLKARKLDSKIHVEKNNNESDGFVAAVHRFSADRLYVPVPKSLLGGALSIPMWASHLPASVSLVLVQRNVVVRQESSFIPAAFRQSDSLLPQRRLKKESSINSVLSSDDRSVGGASAASSGVISLSDMQRSMSESRASTSAAAAAAAANRREVAAVLAAGRGAGGGGGLDDSSSAVEGTVVAGLPPPMSPWFSSSASPRSPSLSHSAQEKATAIGSSSGGSSSGGRSLLKRFFSGSQRKVKGGAGGGSGISAGAMDDGSASCLGPTSVSQRGMQPGVPLSPLSQEALLTSPLTSPPASRAAELHQWVAEGAAWFAVTSNSQGRPKLPQRADLILQLSEDEVSLCTNGFDKTRQAGKFGKFGRLYSGTLPRSFFSVDSHGLAGLWGAEGGGSEHTGLLPVSVLKLAVEGEGSAGREEQVARQLSRQVGLGGNESASLLPYVAWSAVPPCLVSPILPSASLTLQSALSQGLGERKQSLSWRQRVDVLADLALGIYALHSRSPPLLHMAVNPASIFLYPTDTFLHARLAHINLPQLALPLIPHAGEPSFLSAGVPGAAVYFDDDLAAGEPASTASDIFAFGAVVADMLLNAKGPLRKLAVEKLVSTVRAAGTEEREGVAIEMVEYSDATAGWPRRLVVELSYVAAPCLAARRGDRPSAEQVVEMMSVVSEIADEVQLEEDLGGFGIGEVEEEDEEDE